jgi:hypothetical protein
VTLIYRSSVGRPLHASEYDGNIHDLDDRVSAIETALPGLTVKSISTIASVGNQLVITYTDSTTDTFTLPVAHWDFRGPWLPDHPYLANDLFTESGSTYLVNVDHTSPHVFDAGYSPTSGVDAYSLLYSPAALTQILLVRITEEELKDGAPVYVVAPTNGVILGIDAVVQRSLTSHVGHLGVDVSGSPVSDAHVTFSSGSHTAGSIERADVSFPWAFSSGDLITIVPSGWTNISGFDSDLSGLAWATGVIDVSVRYQQT